MNLEVDLASGSNSASGNRNISRPPDNIALTDQQGSSMEKSSSEANEKIESLSSERVLRGDPQENNSAPRAATEDQSDDSSVSNGRVGEAVKSERPESVQQRSEREVTSVGRDHEVNL